MAQGKGVLMQSKSRGASALLAAALAAGCAKPSNSKFMDEIPSRQVRQEIGEVRRGLEQAIARRDAVSLERMLSPDFVHIGGNGALQDKAAFIQHTLGRPALPEASSATDEVLTRVYGNTAVVTGRQVSKDKATAPGEATRFSVVFVRENGQWRAVSLHTTRLAG